MPLYEYECQGCGRRTEKIQKFSDAELTVCPHCGGKLERTITAPAVQFAGGGWYKDGYASAKPAAPGSSASASSDSPGSASNSSSAAGSDAGSGAAGSSTAGSSSTATASSSSTSKE